MSNNFLIYIKKKLSMIRKYHNHTLQTDPRYREEELKNNNKHKTNKVKHAAL